MRRYPKNFKNAKKVYRAKDSTLQALKERGGAPRNNELRRIMTKYYRIVDELEDVLYYGGEDFTEEQAKELTSKLKQLEGFIRATKNVK